LRKPETRRKDSAPTQRAKAAKPPRKALRVDQNKSQNRAKARQATADPAEIYRLLVETAGRAGEGVLLVQTVNGREGVIVSVNDEIERITGYDKDDLLGAPVANFIPPDQAPSLMERYRRRQMGERMISRYEIQALRRDGSLVPLEVGVATTALNGRPATVVFAKDISHHQLVESALRETDKHYRLVAENVSDAIWTTDMNLNITYLSPSHARLLGYPLEELPNLPLEHVLTTESLERALQAHAEQVETLASNKDDPSKHWLFEVELRRKDGSTVWVEEKVNFMRDDTGQAIGLLGVTRDISERKKAEDRLRESEERYRHLVENVDAVAYSVDNRGVTTYISPTFESIFRQSESELVGKPFAEFIHPDDLPGSMENFAKAMTGQLNEPWECRMVMPGSGEIYWVQGHNRPVYKGNSIVGMQGVLVDITDRKKTDEELRKAEERYRTLVESSPDGILTVDSDWHVTDCNNGVCRLLGCPSEQLRGADIRPMVSARTIEAQSSVRAKLDSAGYAELEAELISGDGHKIPVWAKIVEVKDKDQGNPQILVYLRDIEQRRKMDELKDEFIGLVSHELRSPLTVIMGALKTALADGSLLSKEEMQQLLEDAAYETDSLSHLLENLLELSRVQADRLALYVTPVNLRVLVHKVVEQVRRQSTRHRFLVDLPRELPPIQADELRLGRILCNLLENGVNYSPDGGDIRVFAQRNGDVMTIGVSDQGIGISADDQARLFQPFERGEVAKIGGIGGAGLGLLVCRRLVEAHGGKIWVESEPGHGSSFFFTLPSEAKWSKRARPKQRARAS
jgi:PAS domain S-box-containing protein